MTVDLSVTVPLFNEEDNAKPLYDELVAALEPLPLEYEIIFVDDGSQDRTVGRLEKASAENPHVSIVRLRRNYGQTAALQAGFDLAKGNVVVTLDGDLQNDPRDIGRLLEKIDEGYDVVAGWRKQRRDKLLSRNLPSWIANWLIGFVTGVRIHDNGCTLKAYRGEVIKRINLYSEMHRFLAPLLSLTGCRFTEIVVNHRERRYGNSKYGLSRIWKVFLDLLTIKMILRFSSHPAVWFVVLGLPLLAATLVSAGLSLIHYLTSPGGEAAVILPAVTVLLLLASGNLLLFGMFAELVVRTGNFQEAESILTRIEKVEV